ncbi:hypothetical protein ACQ3VH_12785 [Bacillus pretiosus]|uniref:hypothetical protein n=1 Tax=Bacillus pretiosus TaxID=2983392 RepID=UPI003D303988
MPLCIPVIRGPLSEWSKTILVEGSIPGATIIIESKGPNPRMLAKGIASGGSDRLELLSGQRLEVKDQVVVKQQLGGEQSPEMLINYAMPVGPSPIHHDSLAPVSFRTHLWECGNGVWVQGAFPGAQVTIQGPSGVIGNGQATEKGDARLLLTSQLPGAGQTIKTWQEAPAGFPPLGGVAKQTEATVNALPVSSLTPFPVPVLVGKPPKGCDTSMVIGGIFDGAEVTIKHASDGLIEVNIFDLDRLRHVFSQPLSANGDQLEVTQTMSKCHEHRPSDSLKITVEPVQKPDIPKITPPCENAIDVYTENLTPGALVRLTYMGDVYLAKVPQKATSFTFRIVPMQAGQTVSVEQEQCGLVSDLATVKIGGNGGKGADLVEPLLHCARAVRILTKPGTWFQVWAEGSRGPGPISDQIFANQDSIQVLIAPYLHQNQNVWVSFLDCGANSWSSSVLHLVKPLHQDIVPVNITTPLVKGDSEVTVDGIPGSEINVYAIHPILDEHLGSGIIDPLQKTVRLFRQLNEQDQVYAKESLCNWLSRPGPSKGVLPDLRVFHLEKSLQWLSQENNPKPLICSQANVTCRHDGGWEFNAYLENQETEADCSFDLKFSVNGISQPFEILLSGDLSASGNGSVTKIGMRTHGIPPAKTFSRTGHFDGFRNPLYWEEFLKASGKFEFLPPAWNNYQPLPDDPRGDAPGDDPKH